MRRLLQATLEGWGYEVIAANDGGEAWQALQATDAPKLAILDWIMPVFTGPEVCKLVRQQRQGAYTYIILLTSKSMREDIVEGMGAGADDYVVKPFDKHELEVRLRAGRRIIELQTELLQAQEALRDQATRDGLTRCWNRASILGILDQEAARASRAGQSLGVVMVDLDHFKAINDTHGHAAGDEALREAVRRMGATIRPYDALGRMGGEEFLVVLPGCDASGVLKHAERLRHVIADTSMDLCGVPVDVTASFGVSAVPAGAHIPTDRIVKAADDALYESKRTGRNRVLYSSPIEVPSASLG
jgi:diguanylate cyclase (GGDEF)-like protein